ncbi:MAG: pyridoxine 5'-phosphate synthase [Ignavibacteriae bacterium]|nr:pyridoxine 5'-phosphate synthase [Ignavibacteriota bacterium]
MKTLNVNIDHVATVREARAGKEPDPVSAALSAESAGAKGIVCHLREDRRHINDRDVQNLREVIQSKLDLEMAANEEIIKIALNLKPDLVTIVPEGRMELTTEGGLDVAGNTEKFKSLTDRMHSKGIEVSFFVEPDKKQIEASLSCSADMVEFHTGNFANANDENIEKELKKIISASKIAFNSGLKIAAGHGINYLNIRPLCLIPEIGEFSIGHSIISRAIYVGIEIATREMIEVISKSSIK